MNNEIRHPIGIRIEENQWPFQEDDNVTPSIFKSAGTITALAITLFAATYLAYQNPGRWWLTTSCACLVNLYTLPKALNLGSPAMIKVALIANQTALGSLGLGGLGVITFVLSKSLMTFLKTYQFSQVLFSAFLITGFVGYGFPLFLGALKKVHQLLNYPQWQQRILQLHEQFHRMPEVGLGFFQTNLWDSFVLNLTLLKSDYIFTFYQTIEIDPPNYVWAMATAINDYITLDQFQEMIENMADKQMNIRAEILADIQEDMAANIQANLQNNVPVDIQNNIQDEILADIENDIQNDPLGEGGTENNHMRLKAALKSIRKEDLHQATIFLLSNGFKLIPHVISNEQFLSLCTEDALDATNDAIQEFLDSINSWQDLYPRFQKLTNDIFYLESEVNGKNPQQLAPQEIEDLCQLHKKLNEEFNDLHAQIGKAYFNKRIWGKYIPLWDDKMKFPFELGGELLKALHDQALLKEIEEAFLALSDTEYIPPKDANNKQPKPRTLRDRLQHITNKLLPFKKEEDEDPVSALMFLAANQNLVQRDCEDLQEWFNLDSPHDLEEALEKIGLGKEEDLYANDILPRRGALPKIEIMNNLQRYIERAPKPHLANRIRPKAQLNKKSLLIKLIETVTRFFYHAITSGLILIPMLIQPEAAAIGCIFGTSFFILKRLDAPGIQAIADLGNEIKNELPSFVVNFLNRRLFSLSPSRREDARQFVNADFFERMQILNLQIFSSIFIAHIGRGEAPGMGAFFQGVFLANEVFNIV